MNESDLQVPLTDSESASACSKGEPALPDTSDISEVPEESATIPSREPECETDLLRAEVKRLQEELAERDALNERMANESEELYSLYPDADLRSLPDSVWEDVRRGIPLAAAYALAERRRFCTAQKAEASNLRNRRRSAGALDPTESDYFSPAEVRSMTAAEVKRNYTNIMRSMQKWH